AALGRVAAGVAHEIRNPIAAMRLRAENALAGEPHRMRAALGHVLSQITRLDGLVSQLLAMTQRRKSVPQDIQVAAFLQAIIDDYGELARAGGVRVDVAAPPLSGRLDPDLARWAIGNLVLNAIQHTPPGGLVSVSAEVSGPVLRITVADTGPGVAPALRDSLFEPFVTTRPEGTGLGLAIAREFAEAQGGRVSLRRPGGEGTGGAVFALDLPWQPS
ncbi:MAG TPA: HAMP domain-containing sensor histidine kinase, partial [Acetobacteraceae bacterium]|nr:HAMP domain-containing sensor histidine kinase [Acetobacteraceae bacterium]